MKVSVGAVMALLLAAGSSALAADARHYTGAVTVLDKAQGFMVVCQTQDPYTCNRLRVFDGTKVIMFGTGRKTGLGRGEYVDVEARYQAGAPVATVITVHPDQFVRSIPGFKKSQASRVTHTLRSLRGVTGARVLGDLGEVVIAFRKGATSPQRLEKAAKLKGIRLALPG